MSYVLDPYASKHSAYVNVWHTFGLEIIIYLIAF
jgi:hypothetical protein